MAKKRGSWATELRKTSIEANQAFDATVIRMPETALKHMMKYAKLGFTNTYFHVPRIYAEKVQERILREKGIKLFINPVEDTRNGVGDLRFEVEW